MSKIITISLHRDFLMNCDIESRGQLQHEVLFISGKKMR